MPAKVVKYSDVVGICGCLTDMEVRGTLMPDGNLLVTCPLCGRRQILCYNEGNNEWFVLRQVSHDV